MQQVRIIIQRLKTVYRHQAFSPSWLGLLVNPFYFARMNLNKAMTELAPFLNGRLLDVGCGSKPYQPLFHNHVEAYVGLDIDSESAQARGVADHFYDGRSFPFADALFDSLLCNQVLEHVFHPDDFIQEMNRVLKPKGRLLLTVPFVWDEHEQPYDFARYSSFGIRALLERHGFRIMQHKKLGADITTLFQLTNGYLYKISVHWPWPLKLIFTITAMAFVNLLGVIAGKLFPTNPDLFLDHVVLAEKEPGQRSREVQRDGI